MEPWQEHIHGLHLPNPLYILFTVRSRIPMPVRHFPPPWTVDDNGSCFIVRDHNGQALAYTYYEVDPGRRTAANLLTKDEARRIAANIAKLPTFARRPQY